MDALLSFGSTLLDDALPYGSTLIAFAWHVPHQQHEYLGPEIHDKFRTEL